MARPFRPFSSKPTQNYVIGIHFGTTNSCVAVMEGLEAKVILNSEGGWTTPLIVVFYSKEQQVEAKEEEVVGTLANRHAVTNPTNTFLRIKNLMGRKFNDPQTQKEMNISSYKIISALNGDALVEVNDKQYTPSKIGGFVFKKLREAVESYLGNSVSKAVISVPAYFNDEQRQAVEDAGRNAGLNVLEMIDEPIAAALSYGLNKESVLIAVIHLGGATFDVSILEVTNGAFQVKATIGDTFLGGEDFDNALLEYLDMLAIQKLREASENAKRELSNALYTEIYLLYLDALGPKHLYLILTRSTFETLVQNIIQRIQNLCAKCLEDANTNVVDEVLLVGGTTRVPKVQDIVAEIFGKSPRKLVNPDEAVAKGAAIQGGILSDEELKEIILMKATPLTLGVESLGGIFIRVINRNTSIPTKKSQIFSTSDDNETHIGVRVFLGEREFVYDNKLLCAFEFEVSPAPRGLLQIEVTFNIDATGILTVSVNDNATGKEKLATIRSLGSLSEYDIQKMIQDAELHSQKDQERKTMVNLQNAAGITVYRMETFFSYRLKKREKSSGSLEEEEEERLREFREKFPAEVLGEMKKSLDELKQALSSDDMDEIKTKLDAANKAFWRARLSQTG
ncbi:hypothetical protein AQUCO_00700037v1 [Aquilegia coerulea]|uniref:Uncharacterized protein n=1 Tax=Aquilegia coerulea TaxID=218851 RepID=A0A2G5EI74_AQUCA|nr:hypothetical protein AQUCO_00700037v1 [Aquilegia coerulea]